MDITSGKLVNLWNFGPKRKKRIPNIFQIKNALKFTGSKYINIIKYKKKFWIKKKISQVKIDLSSLGEGFIVDSISSFLNFKKIKRFLVKVGGTISVKGKNYNWKIAIQKPIKKNKNIFLQEIFSLENYAVSTAGNYNNFYELNNKQYITHIINPNTGYPIDYNILSVTVFAKTALEADAWDTGLFALGKEAKKIARKEKLAVYIISKNNFHNIWISPQLKKILNINKN